MNNNRKAGKMLFYCGDFFEVTLKKLIRSSKNSY